MKGMSYESIDPAAAGSYLADDRWVAQQKLDGVRIMVHVDHDDIRCLGTNDRPITFAAAALWFGQLYRDLHSLPAGTVLDGELILETGEYWIFDLPYMPGFAKPDMPQADRRQVLEHLAALIDTPWVHVVPEAKGEAAKRALLQATLDGNAEGIVLKDSTAPYAIGRRTRSVLKVKHTKTIDCVVVERNAGGTTSATLALAKDGRLQVVGACSMIGKPDLKPGECCEVKFLYVTESHTLYQPRLMRARPDKLAGDCQWRQIEDLVTSRRVVTV
jgi:ATP-dependent DNA ligase